MSEWYYVANGGQQGPVAERHLQAQFSSGALLRSTLVWKEGMGPWVPASGIPEFAAPAAPTPHVFSAAPAMPPPPPPEFATTAQVTARLEQKHLLKGRRTFEIVDGHTLRFQAGAGKKREPREVPLERIDPHFTRIAHWPTVLLSVAAPVSFLTFIIVTATIVSCFTGSRILDLWTLLGINALFLGIAGVLLALVFRQRRNSAVFEVTGEEPIEFWFENPAKPAFHEFVAKIQAAAETGEAGA